MLPVEEFNKKKKLLLKEILREKLKHKGLYIMRNGYAELDTITGLIYHLNCGDIIGESILF